MRFPNPAVIVTTELEPEPVTGDPDEVITIRYGTDFTERAPREVIYSEGEDYHGWVFKSMEQVGGEVHGTTEYGQVVIRPVRADDAIDLAPGVGVPQPVDVIEAHLLREDDMLAGEVDAAVAVDNSVVTLVLDTGLGLYVRYSGDWQLLPETSSSLEGLALHPVAPAALDVFDAADAAAQTVTIFDLPRTIDNYYTDATDREEEIEAPVGGPTVAAIDSEMDLSNVIRMTAPEAAWYVRKRAQALHPSSGTTAPDVILAAAEFLDAQREGFNVDPQGIIRRDLIRRARKVGLLNHPTVLAAVNWRDWLHPRGRDGKFIETNGTVRIFDGPGDSGERRGKVKRISQDGITVDIIDPETKKVTGTEKVQPNQIEMFDARASLNPESIQVATEFGGPTVEKPAMLKGGGGGVPSTSDGSPVNPLAAEPTPAEMAQALADRAREKEPAITEMLHSVAGNGEFYGEEFRLKEQATIEEKITRWTTGDEPLKDSVLEAGQGMNDTLRYTVHYQPDAYGESTRKALVQLMGKPEVAELRIYNAWENDKPYNGINVEVHMADGMIWELQFHTPDSQVVKNEQHDLYKAQRATTDRAEKARLDQEMRSLADGLERPHGLEEVPTGDRQRNPNPPGNIPLEGGILDDLLGDGDSKFTSVKHLVKQPDGTYDWSPERKALHDAIIEDFLAGKIAPPEGEQPIFSVLGGGPAAGKSTLVNSGLFPALSDPTAVLVNADEIKDRLPEYGQMLNHPNPDTRKEAAAIVHEESSYLAKRLMDAVYTGGFHVVLDGTGDSSPKSMTKKIEEARSNGYLVNGYYTTVPTEDAYQRMMARGKKTGRYVPERILRGTHKSVSQVLPEIASSFDEVGLYDTNERGVAKKIMTGTKGSDVTIHDPGLWREFLAKGSEEPPAAGGAPAGPAV